MCERFWTLPNKTLVERFIRALDDVSIPKKQIEVYVPSYCMVMTYWPTVLLISKYLGKDKFVTRIYLNDGILAPGRDQLRGNSYNIRGCLRFRSEEYARYLVNILEPRQNRCLENPTNPNRRCEKHPKRQSAYGTNRLPDEKLPKQVKQ
jgi:hypothetical protein